MATPSGLGGQFGYKRETTPGTAVVVDQFLPVNSVSIKSQIERLDSQGIRAGRLVTAAWKPGHQEVSGTVEMELWNADIAALIFGMFGNVVTTGTGPYTHTYTPVDLTGKATTMQAGLPDIGGIVRAFTWSGCKINQWTLSAEVDAIAMLELDVVGMTETTATALATASYDAVLAPFVFTQANLTIAGSAVPVKSAEIVGSTGLTDRYRLNSATSKEYLQNDFREYTGTATADFENLTQYNRFINGTEAALVLSFTNGTDTLTVTMNVRFDGEAPELSGPELLELPIAFKAVHATSDASAITAVLVNTDATAA